MPHSYLLKNFSILKFTGSDTKDFLSGQVTSDVKNLAPEKGQASARLSLNGRVQSFFHIGLISNEYYVIVSRCFSEALKADFNKYIIMENVEIEELDCPLHFVFGTGFSQYCSSHFETSICVSRFGAFGSFAWNEKKPLDLKVVSDDKWQDLLLKFGEEDPSKFEVNKHFINGLTLNETSISYKKGCFLGQEPVAKIENNRGAAYYPVALFSEDDLGGIKIGDSLFQLDKKVGNITDKGMLNEKAYIKASLLRNLRIEGREYRLSTDKKSFDVRVSFFPLEGSFDSGTNYKQYYEKALHLYNGENQADEAVAMLEDLYWINDSNKDVCEALGAILGNLKKYESAIKYMNRLEELDPDYGMANTNKSVYYMKLGKIEEAEKEKEIATVKSFKFYGKEADKKEMSEKLEKEQAEALKRRQNMFLQVLQLDPNDTVANYGLADIFYSQNRLNEALEHVQKVVENDEKYSVAYLLLGKILERLEQFDKCKQVFEKGVEVASKNGDLQPANEMQHRLNLLSK